MAEFTRPRMAELPYPPDGRRCLACRKSIPNKRRGGDYCRECWQRFQKIDNVLWARGLTKKKREGFITESYYKRRKREKAALKRFREKRKNARLDKAK